MPLADISFLPLHPQPYLLPASRTNLCAFPPLGFPLLLCVFLGRDCPLPPPPERVSEGWGSPARGIAPCSWPPPSAKGLAVGESQSGLKMFKLCVKKLIVFNVLLHFIFSQGAHWPAHSQQAAPGAGALLIGNPVQDHVPLGSSWLLCEDGACELTPREHAADQASVLSALPKGAPGFLGKAGADMVCSSRLARWVTTPSKLLLNLFFFHILTYKTGLMRIPLHFRHQFQRVLFSHHQAILSPQLSVLQCNSVLTLSSWRQHQIPQVKGSVLTRLLFRCQCKCWLSPVLLTC